MISRLSVRHKLISEEDGRARKKEREEQMQLMHPGRRLHRIKIRTDSKPPKSEHSFSIQSVKPVLVNDIVTMFEDMYGHHGKEAQMRAGFNFRRDLGVNNKDKHRSNFEIVFQHWPDKLGHRDKDMREPLRWATKAEQLCNRAHGR